MISSGFDKRAYIAEGFKLRLMKSYDKDRIAINNTKE